MVEQESKQQKQQEAMGFAKGNHGSICEYKVGRQIGEGGTSIIHLGYDSEQKTHCALKILKKGFAVDKNVKAEVQALSKLRHPNVLRLYKAEANVQYINRKGGKRKVTYMALEYAKGSELFDYISTGGPLPENISRYYYQQLIGVLEFCHSKGFAHRDLKPENLLFSRDFVIKLVDFGFAKMISNGGGKNMKTYLGTPSYMAPEIHNREKYDGEKVDIFALTIILFIIYSGTPAFGSAKESDPYYACLINGKAKTFWKAHARTKPKGYFSKDFQNFIECSLKYDPDERLTIQEIKQHPWYNGPVATKQEVHQEMQKRHNAIIAEQKREREIKIRQIKGRRSQQGNGNNGNLANTGVGTFRDIPDKLVKDFKMEKIQENFEEQFQGWNKKDREILEFEEVGAGLNSYFVKVDETDLLEFLLAVLQTDPTMEKEGGIKLDENAFKIGLSYKLGLGGMTTKFNLTISQYKEDKDIKVVEFHKTDGHIMNFHNKVTEIKEKYLKTLDEHYNSQQES